MARVSGVTWVFKTVLPKFSPCSGMVAVMTSKWCLVRIDGYADKQKAAELGLLDDLLTNARAFE